MMQQLQEKEYCEHCGSKIKEFIVPLSKNNIHVLMNIFRMDSKEAYVKTKDIYTVVKSSSPTAELTRLKYLGAIQPFFTQDDLRKQSKRSGKWIITKAGADFMRKKGTLPSHVIIRNQKVVGFGQSVKIDDASLRWDSEDDIWTQMRGFWQ